MSKETLRGLKKRLNNVINGEEYQKAKDLRNMHIAHDDIKKVQFDLVVKLKDLWSILKEVQDIYNTMNFHLNNTRIHFGEMDDYGELQSLKKFSKLKERINNANMNNENSIDTQELLKILRN